MKKVLLSTIILTILFVICTACNTYENTKKSNFVTSSKGADNGAQSQTANTAQTQTNLSENSLLDLEEYKLDTINVKFDNQTNDNFQNYISSINTNYKDSNLFNIKQALNKYINMNKPDIKSSIVISNNKVNQDKLYELVKKNNKNFLDKDKTNKYTDINSTQLKNIISIISQQINEQLNNNKSINTNVLDNTLKNLKIFESTIFGNGCVENEDAKLCLNFNSIDTLQKQNPDVNMIKRVVQHESNHLIQVGYPKNDEFQYNMGICYSYNDLDINSLYWQWFAEGSAEKLTLKSIEDLPFNYQDHVKALESLTLAKIINKNCNIGDIEKISLQKNLNKLFEYFNATTDKQRKEIIKMMFSYDIIFSNNKEFMESAKESKGNFDLLQMYDYQDELKGSIGITLSKMFYSDLSNLLVNQSAKLEDVYLLIRIFETELCRITDYDNTTKTEKNKDFVDGYCLIQNEFFNNLSGKTDMDKQKIIESYCAYSNSFCDNAKYKNEDTYDLDVNIDWLSNKKNEFLKQIAKSRVSHINQNINN